MKPGKPITHRMVLKNTVSHLWRVACIYDHIDPKSTFVVFSDDNPYTELLTQLCKNY